MFVIALHAPEVAGAVKAGQFVTLVMAPGPLLRRPFSVYRAEGEQIEVILKAVGAGTLLLLSLAQGERVSCLGPLGRGFDLAPGPVSAALISGGLGVAPMPLAGRDARAAGRPVTWVHRPRGADPLSHE